MLSEFDIIQRYFDRPTPGAILGIGDDAALVEPSAGMELAVSTDMLVSGQHFFPDADPQGLGHKSLAVNLSDMAAMGARPCWATLSLALPTTLVGENDKWLQAFSEGFFKIADAYQVALIGGDTTRGPLTICVTVIGEVARGKALRRSGAKSGDDIWISGRLGDAALALAHQQGTIMLEPHEIEGCLAGLNTPTPRIELGEGLIGLAHSAIDISDGLLADLGHILKCSQTSAIVSMPKISCSASLSKYLPHPVALKCLLAGGDDYELCFTAPRSKRAKIDALSRQLVLPLTRVGKIGVGDGLVVLDGAGEVVTLETKGYDHFRD
jgi:thiamine-monophosphate kinase